MFINYWGTSLIIPIKQNLFKHYWSYYFKMKIMQVGTFGSPIKPDMTYGGIQRIIQYLDKEFVRRGHKSLVAAPMGSIIEGTLLPTLKKPLTEMMAEDKRFTSTYEGVNANLAHTAKVLDYIRKEKPDIVHDHVGRLFPFTNQIDVPIITTLHGPKEFFWEPSFYKETLANANLCAISEFQREAYSPIDVKYMVYNGIPTTEFPFSKDKEAFMFMLSLMWKEKGVHDAIEISKRSGLPLILAGKIRDDPNEMGGRGYFESQIKPHIDGKQIKFIGELNDAEKKHYFKHAKVYLHPCSVDESFGLVLTEAMACGTPVIAFNRGAIPEVIKHGKTGFIANSLEEAVQFIPKIDSISNEACRERVASLFDSNVMAERYISVYKSAIKSST